MFRIRLHQLAIDLPEDIYASLADSPFFAPLLADFPPERSPAAVLADVTVRRAVWGADWPAGRPVLELPWPDLETYGKLAGPEPAVHCLACDGGRAEVEAERGVIRCELDPRRPGTILALFGAALSFCLLAKGREVFHGTALAQNGRAVALLGPSGSGKSTLAAELMTRGWALLADDLLAPVCEAQAVLCPRGLPVLKLCPPSQAVFAARFPLAACRSVDLGKHVYAVPPDGKTPVPLAAVYWLEAAEPAPAVAELTPLGGADFLTVLLKNPYNSCVNNPTRLQQQFEFCGRLARGVAGRRLRLPHDYARLAEVAARVAAEAAALTPG